MRIEIKNFLEDYKNGIITIHKRYLKNDNNSSIENLINETLPDLEIGYQEFISKGYPSEELNSYLFYILNERAKSKEVVLEQTYNYLCPGCLYMGKENICQENLFLNCDLCFYEWKVNHSQHLKKFYETFKVHNKSGFRCLDCNRFIPKPLDDNSTIICPYTDCCFIGNVSSLRVMYHPSTKSKSIGIFDNCKKINNFDERIDKLSLIIDEIVYSFPFYSQNLRNKHKVFACQAIKNLLSEKGMVDYLLNNKQSRGFQSKLFQEYLRVIEDSLPLFFEINRKIFKIEDITDCNLPLVYGPQQFEGIVGFNLNIKNTNKDFFIGKLLSVVDKETKIQIMDHVENYSFNKIKVKGLKAGTKVIVSCLKTAPHYNITGLNYINRMKKQIIDKFYEEK